MLVSIIHQGARYQSIFVHCDTSVFSLPHFTNRPPKHFPESTINFVPFNITNHGSMENFYIYSEKSLQKGGNRICTYMYHMLHRIKFKQGERGSVENSQCNARKLVLMADNFVENKCMIFLAFLSHLIHMGWFDEVEIMFGPVGHTHGGNDTVHNVHNNICGNFTSVTLPEFLNYFHLSWTNETVKPQPVAVEFVYDWDSYYESHYNHLGGLTRTKANDLYVRAIGHWKKSFY